MIFELKKDLRIPISATENLGYTFFPKSEFGLSYRRTKQDFVEEVIQIEITIVRISDKRAVASLATATFTAKGRKGALLNETEYQESQLAATLIQEEYNAAIEDRADVLKQHSESPISNFAALMAEKNNTLQIAQDKIDQFTPVVAQYETVDTYADVVKYFTKEGPLTPTGLAWATKFDILGIQISDLVELPQ